MEKNKMEVSKSELIEILNRLEELEKERPELYNKIMNEHVVTPVVCEITNRECPCDQ